MAKISEVIENIRKYGNCQIYYDEHTYNRVINFEATKDGLFKSTVIIEYYADKLHWNGHEFVNNSSCISQEIIYDFSEQDQYFWNGLIDVIIESYDEFYPFNVGITSIKKPASFNTSNLAKRLYSIVDKLFTDLTNKDYMVLAQMGWRNEIFDFWTDRIDGRVTVLDINAEDASKLIEGKAKQVAANFTKILDLWRQIYLGRKDEIAYKIAEQEWERLSSVESNILEDDINRIRKVN